MKRKRLTILLIDEGMNTGIATASKIGGGQVARKRFFSDPDFFHTRVLTSEKQIAQYWKDTADIEFEPDLRIYRPTRIHLASLQVEWGKLLKQSLRAAKTLNHHLTLADEDIVFFNDNKSRCLYVLSLFLNGLQRHHGCTAIEVDGEWQLGAFDRLMKYCYLTVFDKIVSPTDAIRQALGPVEKKYSKKFLTVYPGDDGSNQNEVSMRDEMKYGADLIFGCIGTLRFAVKGQDIIIRAVDQVIRKNGHLPFRICFFGDGPDRSEMERMIIAMGRQKYFEFKGYESNRSKIYAQIDACIISSRTETASLVLMECLVRNIPVITADIESCKEILSRFQTDLSFKRGSHQSLSSTLSRVIKGNLLDAVRTQLEKTDKTIITKKYQVERLYQFLSRGNIDRRALV